MSRDAEIDRIVDQTGMGRLQALRHLQGRDAARDALARRRKAAINAAVQSSGYGIVMDDDSLRPIGEIIQPIMADIAERVS